MFEGLKKKFAGFVDSLTKKEIEREERGASPPEQHVLPEKIAEPENPEHEYKQIHSRETYGVAERKDEAAGETEVHETKVGIDTPGVDAGVKKEKKAVQPQAKRAEQPAGIEKTGITNISKIKGFIFGQVKISEKDVEPFAESLKMGLLQSDVNYEVAERIVSNIQAGLVGKVLSSHDISSQISVVMKDSVRNILNRGSSTDIVKLAQSAKNNGTTPFKILFIGPNGAGKTTTMAKIARLMLDSNLSCVFSASDTFRAAAIEQTVHHADKLGVGIVKGAYGADPASVAFDAIAHAKAHGIDVVLIDSAGRQETNKSLIEELKKIARVAKPDMKIFVGEGIAGNSLLDQVRAIDQAVKIDGIILTKLDVDAKGGNTLSVLADTQIPILFFGTGEKYTDLMRYEPDFVVDNIFGAG